MRILLKLPSVRSVEPDIARTLSPVPYSACNLALTRRPLTNLAQRFNARSTFLALSRSSAAAADSS